MAKYKALIFDCDGVLFDSQLANLAYYNRIFAHFDYPLVCDPNSAAAGLCHTASSPVVLAKLLDNNDVEAALQFARRLDYREFVPLMSEAAGLKSGLAQLAANMPLAIATNRGSSMQELLEHFDLSQHFEVVVTSQDVKKPKPAPDMLLLAAQQLGVAPQQCLFVGDSELDKRAAGGAGMPFTAFGSADIDAVWVDSHAELVTMLLDEVGLLALNEDS